MATSRGVVDSYLTLAAVKGLSQRSQFCIGSNVKLPMIVAAIVEFVRADSPSRAVSASSEVLVALHAKFPCP
ncbi:hypothetical protein LGH82_01500 [Mesorhizobium sp. PAMC28654]|uniref:Rap1a/Tai family immunity protein n=1 Tax=Mesorhizobium sp. PAMC28654 TaxID=2880934 RepID=UPI001D0B4B69|nr:hypothetical protein LGH82_01500 [Mesorhizobium sp. PAMC28654]